MAAIPFGKLLKRGAGGAPPPDLGAAPPPDMGAGPPVGGAPPAGPPPALMNALMSRKGTSAGSPSKPKPKPKRGGKKGY
jgi:hypothetical protein